MAVRTFSYRFSFEIKRIRFSIFYGLIDRNQQAVLEGHLEFDDFQVMMKKELINKKITSFAFHLFYSSFCVLRNSMRIRPVVMMLYVLLVLFCGLVTYAEDRTGEEIFFAKDPAFVETKVFSMSRWRTNR